MESNFCSKFKTTFLIILSLAVFNMLGAQKLPTILSPQENFGFMPGADRMLLNYEELIGYLHKLDQASDKLKMIEIGNSPLGRPMYIVFISSAANIANLENLKQINRELALNPNLSDEEKEKMITSGKVFVLGTLSMHSGEVAPSQSAPLIAYDLITSAETPKVNWLNDVVYMMVPCHNPDGMDMIVDHYNKYKGTKYETSSMPGIYHKYVGHDNNRDFVTLSQEDTRAISRIFSQDWFPQVLVEKHQMGSRGPRYFVPPMHDPIAENVDASIWNWTWIFGSNMVKDMTEQGLAGVSQHYLFDDYWPGSTETCIWKNVIGMLTEGASLNYATPVYIEPNELVTIGKGLAEYKKSINMSMPWPGGWWTLSELIKYEMSSTMSILKTASLQHDEILRCRIEVCQREVQRGQTEPPFYFILPLEQHDQSELVLLVNLLKEHGVEVYSLNKSMLLDGRCLTQGDLVVPLAQPFRAFIKEVLERQRFPERHYTPKGEMIKPYDITSWSLPLHMGVQSWEISTSSQELENALQKIEGRFKLPRNQAEPFWALAFPSNNNESYQMVFQILRMNHQLERVVLDHSVEDHWLPAGSFILSASATKNKQVQALLDGLEINPLVLKEAQQLKTEKLQLPRVGLVETYFHDMDAGWTRYVFDTYHVPFEIIRPADFENYELANKFDVIIFPDVNKSLLMEGKYQGDDKDDYYVTSYPPEFAKGIGKKGMEKLMTFLDKGGRIVSWGQSVDLFIGQLEINRGKEQKEEFRLPVNNIAEQIKQAGFEAPGSLFKIVLKEGNPLTYGMQKEAGVFFRGQPVFATTVPNFDMDRRIIATFPETDILLSGFAEQEEALANKTAMVWLKKGNGQLVLMGFNPQFRASTHVTFKLLFNSILLPRIESTLN